MESTESGAKRTTASSRLRNSGVKAFLMAAPSSPVLLPPNPMVLRSISRAPTLLVMMSTTFRKSASRPEASVSLPWSMTCSIRLKSDGCAFSISSSSTTL